MHTLNPKPCAGAALCSQGKGMKRNGILFVGLFATHVGTTTLGVFTVDLAFRGIGEICVVAV